MQLEEIFHRHHFLIILIKRKEKKNLPVGGTPETHTLRKQIIAENSNVWFRETTPINQKRSIRKLSFTCLVTALPVSCRRRQTLCTALSTFPPGHPGLPARPIWTIYQTINIYLKKKKKMLEKVRKNQLISHRQFVTFMCRLDIHRDCWWRS